MCCVFFNKFLHIRYVNSDIRHNHFTFCMYLFVSLCCFFFAFFRWTIQKYIISLFWCFFKYIHSQYEQINIQVALGRATKKKKKKKIKQFDVAEKHTSNVLFFLCRRWATTTTIKKIAVYFSYIDCIMLMLMHTHDNKKQYIPNAHCKHIKISFGKLTNTNKKKKKWKKCRETITSSIECMRRVMI